MLLGLTDYPLHYHFHEQTPEHPIDVRDHQTRVLLPLELGNGTYPLPFPGFEPAHNCKECFTSALPAPFWTS